MKEDVLNVTFSNVCRSMYTVSSYRYVLSLTSNTSRRVNKITEFPGRKRLYAVLVTRLICVECLKLSVGSEDLVSLSPKYLWSGIPTVLHTPLPVFH